MLKTKLENPAKIAVDAYIAENEQQLTAVVADLAQLCLDRQYAEILQTLAEKIDVEPTDSISANDAARQLAVYQSVVAHATVSEKTVPTVLTALVRQAVLRKLTNKPYSGQTVRTSANSWSNESRIRSLQSQISCRKRDGKDVSDLTAELDRLKAARNKPTVEQVLAAYNLLTAAEQAAFKTQIN